MSGWIHRCRNGSVPCVFPGCVRLLSVPLKDFYESYSFFCEERGRHELDFFLKQLRRKEVFYDIGGFRGVFAFSVISKLQEAASVHVFEPVANNAEAIENICRLNHFGNCKINRLAVAESSALTGKVSSDGMHFQSGEAAAAADGTKFLAVSLDEYIAGGSPAPTIIKIDVEGFELSVLRGARDCLREHRPHLWLEVHPEFLQAQGQSPEVVLNLLREIGYTISCFDDFNALDAKSPYHIWCE